MIDCYYLQFAAPQALLAEEISSSSLIPQKSDDFLLLMVSRLFLSRSAFLSQCPASNCLVPQNRDDVWLAIVGDRLAAVLNLLSICQSVPR